MEEDPTMIEGYDSAATSSDWENLSTTLSSLSSSDDDDDGWSFIKNSDQKTPTSRPSPAAADANDDENSSYGDTDGVQYSAGDGEVYLRELLAEVMPEIAADHRFSLDYIEQHVFPRLPTRALLRLRPGSTRWTSNHFLPHAHSRVSRSLTGLFFNDADSPSYVPLDEEWSPVRSPSLSFLPEPVSIAASNRGLLCCVGESTDTYYICNPATAKWTVLPPLTSPHPEETAAVIVMKEPFCYNFQGDYFLVCAYEIMEGVYGFESFSSENWEWKKSDQIVDVEMIISESGVAASGVAYWRTSKKTVVGYNPVKDKVVVRPMPTEGHSEIGELGGKLCAVRARQSVDVVWVWKDHWWTNLKKRNAKKRLKDEENVVPLRAQGESEVMVWDRLNKEVVVRDVERETVRRLKHDGPGYCADFIPYIGSLLNVMGSNTPKEKDESCSLTSAETALPTKDHCKANGMLLSQG